MPLAQNDIESELSYAYLHAIACKAGMSCKAGDRHDDNSGIDAEVSYRGEINHPYLRHIQLNIQLKATIKDPGNNSAYLSYFLQGVERYNKLRIDDSHIYKLLVVLFLPEESTAWLSCTPEQLILKRSAYWVNLYGASASVNTTGQSIYIPRANLLTPDALRVLVDQAANRNIPPYTLP